MRLGRSSTTRPRHKTAGWFLPHCSIPWGRSRSACLLPGTGLLSSLHSGLKVPPDPREGPVTKPFPSERGVCKQGSLHLSSPQPGSELGLERGQGERGWVMVVGTVPRTRPAMALVTAPPLRKQIELMSLEASPSISVLFFFSGK